MLTRLKNSAANLLKRLSTKGSQRRRLSRSASSSMEVLEQRTMMTVSFKFDYRYDTNGFFNDTSRRQLLELAGRMLGENLGDSLKAIKPSGSNTWTPKITHPGTGQSINLSSSTSVAADEILVFAGGRNINELGIGGAGGYSSNGSSSWNTTVKGRGQSGATASTKTDTAPWGGHITFDTSGTNWHFGTTTAGLSSSESDFLSVAVHELGHVLGINNGNTAFTRLINSSGQFTGKNVKAANNGRTVPMDSGRGHFKEGTTSDGLEAAMDPTITRGTRKFFSALDFAALKDIGWKVNTLDDTITRSKHVLTQKASSGGISESSAVITTGMIGSSTTDVDVYRVWMDSGTTLGVSISNRGSKKFDTYLRLFDAGGRELLKGDQGGIGGKDTMTYRVSNSDYYYVGVSSYKTRSYNPNSTGGRTAGTTGSYQLSISGNDTTTRSFLLASPATDKTFRKDIFGRMIPAL